MGAGTIDDAHAFAQLSVPSSWMEEGRLPAAVKKDQKIDCPVYYCKRSTGAGVAFERRQLGVI